MMMFDKCALELIGVPTFLLEPDGQGRPVYAGVNAAWRDGAKQTLQQVQGKTAQEVFGGRFGQVAYDHHVACMTSAAPSSYDLMLPLGDKIRQARTHLMPVTNDVGDVVQIVGSSVDVTANVDVAEMHTKAETISHEIESYISFAAHDLRTPMRHVATVADMLREDFQDHGDGKLELIDMLEEVARKATELISDVLSHAQARDAHEMQAEFRLRDLCEDLFVLLDPRKKHSFDCADRTLFMDRTALQIVLRNLLDNAIKHAGRAQVQMGIKVREVFHEQGAALLEFTILDNGVGFADPTLAFLDGGKLRHESGFGLLGVRRLIEARGGYISVTNRDGAEGSAIRFGLPGEMRAQTADHARPPLIARPPNPFSGAVFPGSTARN